MNEEIKNKAVELTDEENVEKAFQLSDEEMECISGGKALIIQDIGASRSIHKCSRQNIYGEEFRANLYDSNTCDRYSAQNSRQPKKCSNCKYYMTSTTEYGYSKPSLESYYTYETLQGYDIVHIEG